MDIRFHCDEENNFKNQQQISAFLYSNYDIGPHNHDFYEMNIVLKGTGIHQIENTKLSVKTGDVFVIPPNVVHAYYNTKELDVYHVLLHKDFIRANHKESVLVPGFLQLVEIEPFLRRHFSNDIFLHLSLSNLSHLKTDLDIIDNRNFPDTTKIPPLQKHTTWKIIYWLSGLLSAQINQAKNSSINNNESSIIKALEYIHRNYSKKITIELLCEKTYLSRSTFLRNFFNICDCTPIQYVNRYRCEKALELMSLSNASKTEIAHQCGFYDLSHMERSLKKQS